MVQVMQAHIPVLLEEVLALLQPRRGGVYVDATVGGGGHAEAIAERILPGGRLIGLDLDESALDLAASRLNRFGEAVTLVRANFTAIKAVLADLGIPAVDGVLMDLGLSSLQIAEPERGFSFTLEGPLDMRMDRRQPLRAADLVNELSENALSDLIFRYGEERWARRIASAIVQARPLSTTKELASVVMRAIPRRAWTRTIHPATRTFQALRIAVNRELENLEMALPDAVEKIREGGRICVITFHSLEDRVVKQTFLRLSRGCTCPPGTSPCRCGGRRWLRVLTRHPITPALEEVRRNPRSRSAKLRAAERLADPLTLTLSHQGRGEGMEPSASQPPEGRGEEMGPQSSPGGGMRPLASPEGRGEEGDEEETR